MIAEIKAILHGAVDTPFAIVEGTVALAQLQDRPVAMPAGYVLPVSSASGENRRMNGVLQMTEEHIGVVIIFENLSSPIGDAATDELEALFRWVREQLVGVVLSPLYKAIEHVSGELVKARGGVIWWQETFSITHFQVEKTT